MLEAYNSFGSKTRM